MSEKIAFRELVERIAQIGGESAASADRLVRALTETITEGLMESGRASIANLGKFELRPVRERTGTHPQSGEPITIPAHFRVIFKPYKALREEVNRPYAHLETRILGEDGRTFALGTEKDHQVAVSASPAIDSGAGTESLRTESPEREMGGDLLWQGEVVLRDPPQRSRSNSFFVELDEAEAAVQDEGELILIHPSPAVARSPEPVQPDGRSARYERLRIAERVYWTVLSIVAFIGLLIWLIISLLPGGKAALSDTFDSGDPLVNPAAVQPDKYSPGPVVEEIEIIRILREEGETMRSAGS